MWSIIQPYIAGILTLIGGAWVAAIAKRGNEKTTKIEAESAPYSEVAKRASSLERENRAILKLLNLHEDREMDLEREVERAGGTIPERDARFDRYEKEAFGG